MEKWKKRKKGKNIPEATDGDIAPLLVIAGEVSMISSSLFGNLGKNLWGKKKRKLKEKMEKKEKYLLGLGSAVEGVCAEDTSSEPRAYSSEVLRSAKRPKNVSMSCVM